jgi:hypothetical protein
MQYGQKDPMNHFCTAMNHIALPAIAPANKSKARQANRRTDISVDEPILKLAINIVRYAPAAKPLMGNTPPMDDHLLFNTSSHELPPLHPTIGPPIR